MQILDNQDINKLWHIYGDTIENKKNGNNGWVERASNNKNLIGYNLIIIKGDVPNYIYQKVQKIISNKYKISSGAV